MGHNSEIRFSDIHGNEGIRCVRGADVSGQFTRHVHETYIIGLVEEGERILSIGKTDVIIPRGELFVLNPDESHRCRSGDSGKHSYVAFSVREEFMVSVTSDMGEHKPFLPCFSCCHIRDMQLSDMIRELSGSVEENSGSVDMGYFRKFVEMLIRDYGDEPSELSDSVRYSETIGHVADYIRQHCSETLPLDKLAGMAGMSRFYFQRAFLAETGVTPHEYMMQSRIKHGCRLLLDGQGITDVAYTTGFADQSHFTRVFRNVVGLPPGRYVRLNKP